MYDAMKLYVVTDSKIEKCIHHIANEIMNALYVLLTYRLSDVNRSS